MLEKIHERERGKKGEGFYCNETTCREKAFHPFLATCQAALLHGVLLYYCAAGGSGWGKKSRRKFTRNGRGNPKEQLNES